MWSESDLSLLRVINHLNKERRSTFQQLQEVKDHEVMLLLSTKNTTKIYSEYIINQSFGDISWCHSSVAPEPDVGILWAPFTHHGFIISTTLLQIHRVIFYAFSSVVSWQLQLVLCITNRETGKTAPPRQSFWITRSGPHQILPRSAQTHSGSVLAGSRDFFFHTKPEYSWKT